MKTPTKRPTTLLSTLAVLVMSMVLATPALLATPPASVGPEFSPEIIGDKVREVPREQFPHHPRYPRYPRPMEVEIWTDRGEGATYRVGDPIEIYFRASRNAYVTIYNLDTRGRVNILFPSRYSGDNFVHGGEIYSLPTNGAYHLAVEGPRGRERLRAVASTDRGYRRTYGHPLERGEISYDWSYGNGVPNKLITEVPTVPNRTAVAETSFLVRPRYSRWPSHGPRYPPRYPRYSGR